MKVTTYVLGALGVATVAAIVLVSRRGRAADAAPDNFATVRGKLDALGLGAALASGTDPYVIVAADAAHWEPAVALLRARALQHPEIQYAAVSMELARSLAEDRDVDLPVTAWGGVALVVSGQLATHRFLHGSDGVDAMQAAVLDVERGPARLESAPLRPVTIGFFPPR